MKVRLRIGGSVAFRLWALVHLLYLVGFRNRVSVLAQWTYSYLTHERGARLITGTTPAAPRAALADVHAERHAGQAA